MKKRSQVEILRKRIFWAPNGSRTHDLPDTRLVTWIKYKCKSQIHSSFIHIYHFDTLSLAVWQDTCHTYENLVYDPAHHGSPIAQWLERPTGIWKVMSSIPAGGSENSFSEYFDLRMFLHYLHFIQVTNPLIIYSHLSFRHVVPCSMAGHMSHI